MQTFTHLPIGTLIGAIAFRHQPLAQIACAIASVGPDVVMMPLFALDKIRGRQPLAKQGPILLTLKELSHSLYLSALCMTAGAIWGNVLILAFGIGWISHIVIDILTHSDPTFQAYGDPNYIWPFGSLRNWGIWEYRIETGQLWPVKPIEAYVLATSTLLTLLLWSMP